MLELQVYRPGSVQGAVDLGKNLHLIEDWDNQVCWATEGGRKERRGEKK